MKVITEMEGGKSRLEPNVFFWKDEKGLKGVLCSHVDDFCGGGIEEFLKEMEKMKSMLKIGEQEDSSFKYLRVTAKQDKDKICIEQRKYVESLKEPESKKFTGLRILKPKELTEFRSVVGHLNWIAGHAMPEISYDLSDLSMAFKGGTSEDMRNLIKKVRKAKRINGKTMLENVNENEVYWEVFADASFGSREGGSTPHHGITHGSNI